MYFPPVQTADLKKKYDDEHEALEQSEEARKRFQRECEQMGGKYAELLAQYDKADKNRKKLQSEV